MQGQYRIAVVLLVVVGALTDIAQAYCAAENPNGGAVLTKTALLNQHTPDNTACYLRIHHPLQSDGSATDNTLARGITFLNNVGTVTSVLQVKPNTYNGAGYAENAENTSPTMEIYVGHTTNA